MITISFAPLKGFSSRVTLIEDSDRIESINKIDLFEDSTGTMKLQDVLNKEFEQSELDIPNLKVSKSVTWAKFALKSENVDSDYLIQVEYPLLTQITMYYVTNNEVIDSVNISTQEPFASRKYKSQYFLFDSKLNSYQQLTYYIKLTSNNQTILPIRVGKKQMLLEESLVRDIVFGLYFGIIVVLVLYNLFVYFTVRDREYIYYVLYILFVGLTQAIFNGYAFKYLWPNNMWLSSHAVTIIGSLSGIFMAFFVIDFLRLKTLLKKSLYPYYLFIGLYSISIISSILGYEHLSFEITDVCAGLITFYTFFVGIIVVRKKYKPAKFFLLAWTVFLVGVFVFVLRNLGVLPYNNYTNYTMPLGSALEGILLSLALADKINVFKKEKEQSQAEALIMAQENAKIIREQNIVLEQKVKERTVELQQSNEELNATLENLKDTQAQLVDSEKMASLGQLTAGIAHEINNPINFVTSNITPLKHDISDIMELLDKYGDISGPDQLDVKLKEIRQLEEEIDIDYVKEEIESLLKGIQEGAERTSEIVRGLKNFSRLDENDLKKADINEGIDSTLTLLNNKLKDNLTVVKKYDQLPQIDCYPGKINQLLMNIINNAIHAIEAREDLKNGEGKIEIRTKELEKEVLIQVEDTGIGMDEMTKKKMFDPFYTTKEVGKGTGLGMSIVYKIIQNHKGRIEIDSVLGKGTTVSIYLPKIV